jgi:iron complex outermembrane receptor protein
MQRAGIAELAPSVFVNVTNRNATGGNAQLKPPKSDNVDLAIEYYLDEGSMLSAALFHKDVTDFIASNTTLSVFPGYEGLGEIPYTRPDNVASAKVRGVELGMQMFFDYLPAPFDGLGLIANYTYSDARDSNGFPLVATSRNSFNLIALYESGPLAFRLAYNFRDRALFEFTEKRPNFIDSTSQLDAQLSYRISDRVSFEVQGQNLLPENAATVEYSVIGPVALNSYALSERRLSLGLRARF